MLHLLLACGLSALGGLHTPEHGAAPDERTLYVDPRKGSEGAAGSRSDPLASIAAALERLPEVLHYDIEIHLAGGRYAATGGERGARNSLQLWQRMAPEVAVRFIGPASGEPAVFDWNGGRRMVDIREGRWMFKDVQIGSFSKQQRRGVMVTGPGRAVLENVTMRLRSDSDAGIYARDGGRIHLRGAIRLNEQLHDEAEDETFCGLIATDHGVIEFDQKQGSSLDVGNGSLSVSYYGSIRLGCERARITSWTRSNTLTINNGGRIDLRNTPTTVRAARKGNWAIGLEHDGHMLAEDAHITIVGPNESAIALQKASTFTCNDIELQGDFKTTLWAASGSMFVGRFLGDVTGVEAQTGAGIHIERVKGEVVGPVRAESGAVISLPDRVVR